MITYKERQERRIRRKFGMNGVALGADEERKGKLEKGKKLAGKPRVAGSARGRELRAAAALARFETPKEALKSRDDDLVTDSEVETEAEGKEERDVLIKTEAKDFVDLDGSTLFGRDGLPLVKVCEDEDKDDDVVKNELLELQHFEDTARQSQLSKAPLRHSPTASRSSNPSMQTLTKAQFFLSANEGKPGGIASTVSGIAYDICDAERFARTKVEKQDHPSAKSGFSIAKTSCPVCSMENESGALTCIACSNVLKPDSIPNCWQCQSPHCQGSEYMNAGDVGICGVCAGRKCPEGT